MEIIKREYEVYEFSELSEEAKKKAIEKLWDINVYEDWHEYLVEDLKMELEECGISFNEVYFDADRDSYAYLDKPHVDDTRLLIKKCGLKFKYSELKYLLLNDCSIGTKYYGGSRAGNYIDENEQLNDWLYSKLEDFLNKFRNGYDKLTNEKAIIGAIEANDYKFYKDGKLFY